MNRSAVNINMVRSVAGSTRDVAAAARSTVTSSAHAVASLAQAAVIDRLPRKPADPDSPNAGLPGEIDWDRADAMVAVATGIVAAVVDTVVVRTPEPVSLRFKRRPIGGSPITRWVHPNRHLGTQRRLHGLGQYAHVPFDPSQLPDPDGQTADLFPDSHRLRSLGHDPVVGLLIGVRDIADGMWTYVDKEGRILRQRNVNFDQVRLPRALMREMLHLASDFYDPDGVPAPLFGLLQIGALPTPFRIGESRRQSLTAVAKYMYMSGYDMRHFVTMAIVPTFIEANIRLYWRATADIRPAAAAGQARRAGMLVRAHAIALSADVFTTAAVFNGEPTALNWAEMIALPVAAGGWIATRPADGRT